MSAPNIISTTIGMSLPSFTITRELEGKAVTKLPGAVVQQAKASTRTVSPRARSRVLAGVSGIALAVCSLGMFVWYLVSVNTLEGLSYTMHSVQKEVGVKQDAQRQLQVRIAESSAHLRMQEQSGQQHGFVAVGTPEFVSEQSGQVSMR